MWREMPQNHIKLFTSKKGKWFSRGFSLRSVRREAEYGTTASQTPLLSYRPNNVQRAPWCTISFRLPRSCSVSVSLYYFFFQRTPAPPKWWNAHFFSGRGGGIPIPGSRNKERGGWGDSEEDMTELVKQKKSERRSDYCCGERVSHLTQQEEGQAGDKCSGASLTYFLWFLLCSYKQYCMTAKSKRTNTHTHLSFCTAINEGNKEQGSKWWCTSIT